MDVGGDGAQAARPAPAAASGAGVTPPNAVSGGGEAAVGAGAGGAGAGSAAPASAGSEDPVPSKAPIVIVDVNDMDEAALRAACAVSYMEEMQEILPGLWYGSKWCAQNEAVMRRAGVTRVLSVMDDHLPAKLDGVQYRQLEVKDSSDPSSVGTMTRVVPEALDWVKKELHAGRRVLVHCQHGMSRSGAVVLAFCMRHGGMSLRQAMLHVLAKRRVCCPNDGFIDLLSRWEHEWTGAEEPTMSADERKAWKLIGFFSTWPMPFSHAVQVAKDTSSFDEAFDVLVAVYG